MKKETTSTLKPGTWKQPTVWEQMKLNKTSYVMVAPFMILFFLFTVIPVVASLVLSFTYFNMLQFPTWVGLANYQQLFLNDDIFIIAIKNTLTFAIITGPVAYLLCFFFAWFINELPPKVRAFMTLVFYAPSISGAIFVIWAFLLSGDAYGFVNGTLIRWNIISQPMQFFTDTKYMFVVVVVIQLWLSLGTSFLAFIAGFQNVDRTLYEAGAVDGVKNRFQELIHITIPAMKPQMLFGAIMQIAGAFAIGAVGQALCGFPSTNYAVHTVIDHIRDYGSVRYEMGYAAAISFMLTVVMILTRNLIVKILKPGE